MLNKEAAKHLALKHVNSLDNPAEGYQLTFGRFQKVEHGWFFNYEVICKIGERPNFGGYQ